MIPTILLLLIVLILILSCSIMVNVLTKVKQEKRDTRPFVYIICFFGINWKGVIIFWSVV